MRVMIRLLLPLPYFEMIDQQLQMKVATCLHRGTDPLVMNEKVRRMSFGIHRIIIISLSDEASKKNFLNFSMH